VPTDAPAGATEPDRREPDRFDLVGRLRAAGCVFAEDEARLLTGAAVTAAELADLVARRIAGEPLEHVLGWAEFCGLRIAVEPGVFVPRRRTELLVREAVALLRGADVADAALPAAAGAAVPVLVDLCCGSGAVATAVAHAVRPVEVHAADVDPAAVRCARDNVVPAGGAVHEGDLFDALPRSLRGRVDVLVANAPYVPTDAIALMPPEARTHEPHVALDGGADGLDVARRVVAGAAPWLSPRGAVVVETSRTQAPALVAAVRAAGFVPRVARSRSLDATAVVGARVARRT
jgi:release factor glutamine methyltransferase